MALFTRSTQPSIQSRVDLDLALLSPTDQSNWLRECIDKMHDTSAYPVLKPQKESVMRGYCDVPEGDYWVEVHTPRIPIWVSAKDAAVSHYITWYDIDNNTLTYGVEDAVADSILWLHVPTREEDGFVPTRLTYAGKTIYLECPKVQANPLLIYFIDQYGLPQCISLNKSQYKLGYETLGSYRCYNDGLKHEYHKQANYTIALAEEGYQKDWIPYLNGFVLSEAYLCQFETENKSSLVPCAMTGVSTSIEKKELTTALVATMEIHPTDAMLIEQNYYEK